MTAKKKLLVVLVALVALVATVVASVMGTIAYLTASAAVSNVFTVGNVQITMDETKVKPDGTPDTNATGRVDTNSYHLVPGKKYLKDPTIHVNTGSENSYLFVLVRNDLAAIGPDAQSSYMTIAEQMEYLGWELYTSAATGSVYVYCGNAAGNEEQTVAGVDGKTFRTSNTSTAWKAATPTVAGESYKLFEYFYTNNDIKDLSTYGAAKITLTAVAIQITGFAGEVGSQESVTAAWKAVLETYPYIYTGNTNSTPSN